MITDTIADTFEKVAICFAVTVIKLCVLGGAITIICGIASLINF